MDYGITSEHVRILRALSQLTREEFAAKIGVSAELIKKIVNDRWHVTERTARKIAQAFDLSAQDITELREFGRRYTVSK